MALDSKYTNESNDISASMKEFLILLNCNVVEQDQLESLVNAGKKEYVKKMHKYAITQLSSTNKYKDGKWKTYYYEDGKRKEIIRNTEEEINMELFDLYKSQEDASKTFAYVVELLMKRKLENLNRSYNTIVDNRRYLSYLNEKIQNTPINEITEEDLREWLQKDFMPTKPKETSLRKVLQLLRELFRFGIASKLCISNPAEYILIDDYIKDCNLQRKTDEQRAFSEDELLMIHNDAMKTTSNPRSLMTLLAIETGLRAGELAALHESDIEDGYIHVHRQQLRDRSSGHQVFVEADYTKDERKHPHNGRYVPITKACSNVLSLAKQLPGNSDHVFHDKKGNPISKDSYEHNLRRRCARLGIETSHNHAFRVAFNSRLINMGFSAADRALILGHAVETNERHYSRSDRRRLDDIKHRLNQ